MARKRLDIFLNLQAAGFRRGMRAARGDVSSLADSFLNLRFAMTAAFSAAAAGAIRVGAQFEQSMANIAAQTGATDAELASLEQTARQFGATTSFSAREVADAMAVLAKSGLTVNETISATEGVLALAGSEMADMTITAELLVSVLNAFQLPASQATEVVNTLAAGAQAGRLDVERLAAAFANAAAISGDLGFSLAETTAAISVLVDRGIDASAAGTQLRAAFANLLKPSEDLAAIIGDLDPRLLGIAGTIEALRELGIEGATAFENLNVRGAQAISLVQAFGGDALVELTESLEGTTAAMDAFGRQQETTLNAGRRVLSALQELALALYSTFRDDLLAVLDWIALALLGMREEVVMFGGVAVATVQSVILGFRLLWQAIFEVNEILGSLAGAFEGMTFWDFVSGEFGARLQEALVGSVQTSWERMLEVWNEGTGAIEVRWAETMERVKALTAAGTDDVREMVEGVYQAFEWTPTVDFVEQGLGDWRSSLVNWRQANLVTADDVENAWVGAFQTVTSALVSAADAGEIAWRAFSETVITLLNTIIRKLIETRGIMASLQYFPLLGLGFAALGALGSVFRSSPATSSGPEYSAPAPDLRSSVSVTNNFPAGSLIFANRQEDIDLLADRIERTIARRLGRTFLAREL